MEQRNEAASNHASLLTCSFLFRALARLQPPAGLIETAMERERERSLIALIKFAVGQGHKRNVYLNIYIYDMYTYMYTYIYI